MAINTNPINTSGLAAYAGNRIGNLGLNFTPPGGFAPPQSASGNMMSSIAKGLSGLQAGMQEKGQAAQGQQKQQAAFAQAQSMQKKKLEQGMQMQKMKLKAEKEARAEKFKFEVDKVSKEKAKTMSPEKLKKRVATSLMYINSPELTNDTKKTKAFMDALVIQDVYSKIEAKAFTGATPKQRAQTLKAELVTSGDALTIASSRPTPLALGTSPKNATQKQLMDMEKGYESLLSIEKSFDPEFLTYSGQGKAKISKIAEKAEGLPFGLGGVVDKVAGSLTGMDKGERSEFITKGTKLINKTEQFFNDYRKNITGAAAAVKELEMLRKSFISGDMAPSEFTASLDTIKGKYLGNMEFYKKQLREGQDIGEGQPEHSSRVQSYIEMKVQQGHSRDEVIQALKAGGKL